MEYLFFQDSGQSAQKKEKRESGNYKKERNWPKEKKSFDLYNLTDIIMPKHIIKIIVQGIGETYYGKFLTSQGMDFLGEEESKEERGKA